MGQYEIQLQINNKKINNSIIICIGIAQALCKKNVQGGFVTKTSLTTPTHKVYSTIKLYFLYFNYSYTMYNEDNR